MPRPALPKRSPNAPQRSKGKPPGRGVEVLAQERYDALTQLLGWAVPVPESWIEEGKTAVGGADVDLPQTVESLPCDNYDTLIRYWKAALRWRQDLDDVLSVMLAVALSTQQQGDQLFCMVIGDAGSGKTRLCDAMLVSKHCYPLEHLTGFFSGFKGQDGKDYSLISRVNGKLMITPEGDVLMSNPKFPEIMAQQRRIFDGVSGATYKNRDEDLRYSGLRTPWIMAGTPALLESDQSRLGDRFLKVFVETPIESDKRDILRRVSRSALAAVQVEAAGENHVGEKLEEAYARTGGYVDWLRDNNGLLAEVIVDDETLDYCESLGDFVSFLRARPSKNEDGAPTRELPTRLTAQFVRLMVCLIVVTSKREPDPDVMRRVRRVALDTSYGIGRSIVRLLYNQNNRYLPNKAFHNQLRYSAGAIDKQLKLMKQIGALQLSTEDPAYKQKTAKAFWRMTPRMAELSEILWRGYTKDS